MSLSKTELIYLMAYVDGLVDEDELPEVTELLARSEEARQVVAQHGALGDWVRLSSDTRAREAGADRIAAYVLTEIDKLGGGKVIEIERERGRVALHRQRVKEFSVIFAVAAMAAAFLLMPTRASETVARAPAASARAKSPISQGPGASSGTAVASNPAASSSSSAAVASNEAESAEPEVDVQSVESPSHPFSIFYVPAATGLNAHASSVVVWIGEEPAP